MQANGSRAAALVAAAACLLLSAVYLPALGSFFSNDDWVLLHHNGQIPLSRAWEFFSPRTIWFYRPLQSLQFGLFYQWFGLDPVPYNIALLAAHLGVCALGYLLVRELSGRPWLAALATILFAGQWIYADILLWKSNFNTVQWALLTLAACWTYCRSFRDGHPGWRRAALALFALNFFTKESAVSTVLLFGLLWAFHSLGAADLKRESWVPTARRALAALWPACALTLGYVVLHRLFVRDVYDAVQPDYSFVGPWDAVRQSLFIYNHALFSFHRDPVLLANVPNVREWLGAGLEWFLVVPFLLLVLGWKLRDRVLLFGVAWLFLAFVPCVFLKSFHTSRFYYVPALGATLVQAHLLSYAWKLLLRAPRPAWRMARLALPAAALYGLVANVSLTHLLVGMDQVQSEQARGVFRLLAGMRGQLPAGTVIVLRNTPTAFFNGGLGAREMARLALQDPTAEGVMDGQKMDDARLARLRAIETVYLIDMARSPLVVQRVRTSRRAEGPAKAAAPGT